MKRFITAAACLALLVAIAAPIASAQNPTGTNYDKSGLLGNIGDTGNPGGGSGSPVSASSSDGSLPFTGLDLAVVALLGVVLVGTGLVVRKGLGGPRDARS
jgi:hypothetical protein